MMLQCLDNLSRRTFSLGCQLLHMQPLYQVSDRSVADDCLNSADMQSLIID